MLRPAMRVAVIGCGTGGPAAALLLSHAGHTVTLFEREPAFGAAGAGFLLQPTGQCVLAELGLLDAIEAAGARVERLFSRTRSGATLLDLAYASLAQGVHGIGMHRATLLDLMVRALANSAGWLRDLTFPWMGRIPPIERQMLRSMAGLKRGLLLRSAPIDADPRTSVG